MKYLVLRSYMLLIGVDFTMKLRGFKRLHESLRQRSTEAIPVSHRISHESLCRAMDLACVFYPKVVLCLQRSAATVFLLRKHGWPAILVTGCNLGVSEDHAWAELDDNVINDKPYMLEIYQVLDRC